MAWQCDVLQSGSNVIRNSISVNADAKQALSMRTVIINSLGSIHGLTSGRDFYVEKFWGGPISTSAFFCLLYLNTECSVNPFLSICRGAYSKKPARLHEVFSKSKLQWICAVVKSNLCRLKYWFRINRNMIFRATNAAKSFGERKQEKVVQFKQNSWYMTLLFWLRCYIQCKEGKKFGTK